MPETQETPLNGVDQHLMQMRMRQEVGSAHINYAFGRGSHSARSSAAITRADAAAYICHKLPKESHSRKLLVEMHRLSEEQIKGSTHNPFMPRA